MYNKYRISEIISYNINNIGISTPRYTTSCSIWVWNPRSYPCCEGHIRILWHFVSILCGISVSYGATLCEELGLIMFIFSFVLFSSFQFLYVSKKKNDLLRRLNKFSLSYPMNYNFAVKFFSFAAGGVRSRLPRTWTVFFSSSYFFDVNTLRC